MEKQGEYQPSGDFDEKPPVHEPGKNAEKETRQTNTNQPLDDDTPMPGTPSEAPLAEEMKEKDAIEAEHEYITGLKLMLVLIAVVLACFLMLLDNSIVATYSFMSFLALFELGSLLCGVAQSSKMLIVGRAVAGLGGSGLMNGALTIISACVPLQKRGVYLGFMMAIIQLGILLGPLIGGVLTEYATWRWCFYINLPIGAVAFVFIIFISIPEVRVKTTNKLTFQSVFKSLDIAGFFLFAPAAIQFLLALEWGGTTYRWDSATVIGLFCGSAGTLAVFIAWEHHRGDAAMIPLSMLKRTVVWSSCLDMFFLFGNMMTVTYYLAIYFQAVRNDSPTISGVSTLPTIISTMIMAITSGVLVGRLGYYLPWAVIAAGGSAIGCGLLSTLGPHSSIGAWIGYQVVGGITRGGGMQMSIIAIQNNLKPEQSAVAMALVVFCQTFGGALFLAFDQTAFSNSLNQALHKYAPEVNAEAVVNAGATGFRAIVDPRSIDGVVQAYSEAVSNVFYVGVGAGAGAFIFCWGMGWKSIKKPKVVTPEA